MNLEELNENQREAVLCLDAPSLVIAGAGSGKTRVLTYKIAYLLEQGVKPWNILALTFTNKAAKEMRERIGRLVGEAKAAPLWMGTFHSVFSRILRNESRLIGYESNFTIYDAADSKNLVTDIVREMQLNDKVYKAGTVCARISNAKNALILPAAYQANPDFRLRDQRDGMASIGRIYERYEQRLRQSNAMDFDDMLLYTWQLLEQHPDVAERWEQRFEYVLVDEYQDTNYAQHQIVWLLTQHRQRLTVVGDDAQSIYSFRGADIDNILQFQERYLSSRLFKLEQNYRSTQVIVGAANSLIGHNRRQIHKDVFSRQEEGERISFFHTQSDFDESLTVQREISRLMRDYGLNPSSIAILYRTNAQSRALEDALRKAGIPYRIYGGMSFYQRKEIKDAIAYLRLIVNPNDELALMRIINYPTRGIGDTTLAKARAAALANNLPIWEVLQHTELLDVSQGTKTKIANFVAMMQGFISRVNDDDAYTLAMDALSQSGLHAEVMKGTAPDDISRHENMQELMDHMKSFVEEKREEGADALLHNYLEEVSLLTDLDENQSAGQDCVTLMTVHASKGLEFDAVFVVGLEEQLFPSPLSNDSPRELEEERRLFYVAMTRARRYLTLTCAKSRFRYGKIEMSSPSRFLSEIDPRFLVPRTLGGSTAVFERPQRRTFDTASDVRPLRRIVPPRPQPSAPSSSRTLRPLTKAAAPSGVNSTMATTALSVGQLIEHERFGRGRVQSVEGAGIDAKATILFDNGESRKLLLRFARLKVLG